MTGENQPWSAKRSKLWQFGWRNLQFPDGPPIEAQLLVEGRTLLMRSALGEERKHHLDGATKVKFLARSYGRKLC